MNGAECLLRTLLVNNVDVCFMNPGTSEMQFVAALDRAPQMRGVLCLFEGVCSGAADGYARMTGNPAAALLHLGPGLGNALANLHNARKARSPVVTIVGDHSTGHDAYDAPLTADVEAFARTVSGWVGRAESSSLMGERTAAAVAAAIEPPGQVATLIVPADHSWNTAGPVGPRVACIGRAAPSAERIEEAARLVRSGNTTGLLLSGRALSSEGIEAAGRIAARTGVRVFANRYAARIERGGARSHVQRLAYFPEPAEAMLEGLKNLILVEAGQPPVSFFGYPGRDSVVAPAGCAFPVLAEETEDGVVGLMAVAEKAGAGRFQSGAASRPALPRGEQLSIDSIGRALAALLPEDSIVSDEMVSSGEGVNAHLATAGPHTLLPVTGGSIGQCLPVALGAAIACPDRKVVALEADGSGMYTLQALWTMAREKLNVVTVIFANRRYRILDVEMKRTGVAEIGSRANEMMDLTRPELNWVKLAEGHGVEASRADTADQFIDQFESAVRADGPRLIEAVIGGM